LEAKEPDYRIIGDKLGECGVIWNKVRIISGKFFISITLEHPNISDRKVHASTDLVKGSKDKPLAIIWNLRKLALEFIYIPVWHSSGGLFQV